MPHTCPTRVRLILGLCARLVPADRRASWRQQWMGDLAAQAGFLASEGLAPDRKSVV